MAEVTALIHALNAGEVSTSALARVDNEKLRLAAEVQENILPYVIGKGQMRPGTSYLGASKSDNQARGIAFVRSVSANYGLELTNANLRIWTSDALLTRASVTSSVTNGDFSSGTGWTLTATGGGLADVSSTVSGALVLSQVNRGGTALCKRSVTTSTTGTEHALRIVVTRGPVFFRCGSADGLDDYITGTNLDTGEHSLAFTPSASPYYVEFQAISDRQTIVDSITVESSGVVEFTTAPWATAELFEIQYAQSVDVMWVVHGNWQPRKIERRGATSWSLVRYYPDDGPFALPSSADKNVTITPGKAYGNTTLTASGALFRSTDVGALIKTNAGGFDSTFALAAANTFSEPIRVKGIGTDNAFSFVRSGTWAGTLTLQLSFEGPQGVFSDFLPGATAVTGNGTTSEDPPTTYDNLVCWFRAGFKAGNFTSGVANVQLLFGTTPFGAAIGAVGTLTASSIASVPGIYRITAYTSATSVDVEVLSPPSSLGATNDWRRGEFSDRRGWPRAVAFHDGRLWLGRDDRPAGSVSDNFYSFATQQTDTAGNLSVTDASSIQKNIATSSMQATMRWMLSLQRLIIGTDGAEVSARADAFDAPLTPTASSLKEFSNIGVSGVSPVKFGSRAFFVSGSGDKLYAIGYDFQSQDYDCDDLTELNEDIGSGGGTNAFTLTQLAVQRKPQPYVWCVRSDGALLLFLYSLKHQISGWFKMLSSGASGVVESVYVLPTASGQDRVYLWVRRTIGGVDKRYLEKLCLPTEAIGASTTKLADSGLLTAGPVSSVTLAHLASQTGLVGWGTTGGVAKPITGLSADGSGVVALGATYTNVFVGLPYVGRYKSAKLAYGAKRGTALLQPKRVPLLGLLASYMHRDAVVYGRSFDDNGGSMWPFGVRSKDGSAVAANTVHTVWDEQMGSFGGGWDTDSRIVLQIAAGYPATINGIVMGVETNES